MIVLPTKARRILVVGAGSGRDMAHALLCVGEIQKQGTYVVDLAGFLTPWAHHLFNGKMERPVNILTGNLEKVSRKNHLLKLSGGYEHLLPKLCEKYGLQVNRHILFSLQKGSERIQKAFNSLCRTQKYDVIIVFDVGGDCLAKPKDLRHVYTPIVDRTCLQIVANTPSKITKILIVLAPGTDGELPHRTLTKNISILKKEGALLEKKTNIFTRVSYKKMVIINEELNRTTGKTSNTAQLMEIMKKSPTEKRSTTFFWPSPLSKKAPGKRSRVLLKTLCTSLFVFDLPKTWKTIGKNTHFLNIEEAHAKMKNICAGTELDLEPRC